MFTQAVSELERTSSFVDINIENILEVKQNTSYHNDFQDGKYYLYTLKIKVVRCSTKSLQGALLNSRVRLKYKSSK